MQYRIIYSETKGRLTEIQSFRSRPLDWNLFHAITDNVFLFFSRHTKVRDLDNATMTWKRNLSLIVDKINIHFFYAKEYTPEEILLGL